MLIGRSYCMYGRKRKSSSNGSQGSAKRYRTGGSYIRSPRTWLSRPRGRGFPLRSAPSTAIIRQPSGVPDRLQVKLIYREALTWTQASGNVGDNVYRANSLFDPDLTGTGGQPLGFDQWAAFYFYYTVTGVSVEVTNMCNGAVINNCRTGITFSILSNAYATTDQDRVEAQPYTTAKSLWMGNTTSGTSTQKAYMSTAKIMGALPIAVQTEDAFSALVTANPGAPWFMHVWNYVPSLATQSLYQNVKITFHCVFYGRTSLAVS